MAERKPRGATTSAAKGRKKAPAVPGRVTLSKSKSTAAHSTIELEPASKHITQGPTSQNTEKEAAELTSLYPIVPFVSLELDQVRDRLEKYQPFKRLSPAPQAQAKNDVTVPHHFRELDRWKHRIPRFLFRGFHSRSGGKAILNRSRIIEPHAFHGENGKGEPWPWDKGGKPVTKMTLARMTHEINGHLTGSRVQTHFSSLAWAADLNTAISFAGASPTAMIAVMDTTLRNPLTEIYHVPALAAADIAYSEYPEEYLVYGPVMGTAYCCCVSLDELNNSCGFSRYASEVDCCWNLDTAASTRLATVHLEYASKVASHFRHEVFKTAGPDLFLTVFAAELGRTAAQRWRLSESRSRHRGLGTYSALSHNDLQFILAHLSDNIQDAALCNIEQLVNPNTYTGGFIQLKIMVEILMAVENEIRKRRSEWSSRTRMQDADHRNGPGRGAKRKADSNPPPSKKKRKNA